MATKVTTPPSTGSTGLLAVTVTASGLANAVPMPSICGVLPATGVRVKPWLSKAPMSGSGVSSGLAALVGGDAGLTAMPGADGRAAGQQGHGLGRPAVVAQRGQAQVGEAGQTMLPSTPLTSPPEPPVPIRLYAARDVGDRRCRWRRRIGVAGDDRVGQRGRAVPALYRPPPTCRAELPLTVQSVRLAVPELYTPPPLPAELPLTVQSVRLAVPELYTPPP